LFSNEMFIESSWDDATGRITASCLGHDESSPG
jgi:hypothetical protein